MSGPEASMWGGRFTEAPDERMWRYTASLSYDRRLWRHDVRASRAHARMLGRCGILRPEEADRIVAGLETLEDEIAARPELLDGPDEDVHSAVERLLHERIGPVALKLHTARSRNDQVATDLRLYAREACVLLDRAAASLQETLLDRAEQEAQTLLPGLTHLQPAQPVTLGHHLMAYVEMLFRDRQRLREAHGRASVLPLGAGALAGAAFALDRASVAAELGFHALCPNSLDAVSDRDFVLDVLYAAAVIMMHLSRLGEELVLWNHPAFGFVELPDRLATGSSMMPQKKNPDAAELMRGRAGRVAGHLVGLLMVLKGLPLAYNRDLQEDKEPLFDAVDQTVASLEMAAELMGSVRFRRDRMRQACTPDMLATELADYLARRGMPFREAHRIVGNVVQEAARRGVALTGLSPEDLRRHSPLFGNEVKERLTFEAALEARSLPGGTAPSAVRQAIAQARVRLREMGGWPEPPSAAGAA
ncbi:argininosuccinate lyase [Carboxydochorda subterranea]|uniref:Argininosuccinate lyase n=1 Tax=Carboxydichorda subterranea TaxID=3109565 RepID=A0ABZ1BV03_9FIRM|nr:argininosuccinate lyase [Limnochorda sp. L945t]WRP16413.1 argininosuccinate lyase [Limnochorda sp. L945t]